MKPLTPSSLRKRRSVAGGGGSNCEFLITCEHGGKRIPAAYRDCFAGQQDLLDSHRGYDPGALAMARHLAKGLDAPLLYATTSRLLVDLNRSPRHPRLHAGAIRRLPANLRQRILERHYLPFRAQAETLIARALGQGKRMVHISSHSFTPVLGGVVRSADIGLLYDPARAGEAALCKYWQVCLAAANAHLRVRRNYPYAGKSDGFTAYLRRRFPASHYIGIELEINQSLAVDRARARRLRAIVLAGLVDALACLERGGAVAAESRHRSAGTASDGVL